MTSSNPNEADSGSATIKYGRGFEAPWYVPKGSPEKIREQLITFFGMDRDSVADMTGNEVLLEANTIAQAAYTAMSQTGGRVLSKGTAAEATTAPAATTTAPTEDPWAQAAAESASVAANPMLALIAGAGNVKGLQDLWADNQSAFMTAPDAAEVMAAWKAKGLALSAAA